MASPLWRVPGRRQGATLLAALLLGGQARASSVVDDLRFARGVLCADCDDDIERDGVNRPARRSMLAQGVLRRVRDRLPAPEARRRVDAAIELLESQDEPGAMREIDAALAALGAPPR